MTEPIKVEITSAEEHITGLERKVIDAARQYAALTRNVINALEGRVSTAVSVELVELHRAVMDLEAVTRSEMQKAGGACDHFKNRVDAFFRHIGLAFRVLFNRCAQCELAEWARREQAGSTRA